MPLINDNSKEIHCKLVYWGPKGSGKSSSLKQIKKQSDQKKFFSIDLNPMEENLYILDAGHLLNLKLFFQILDMPDVGLESQASLLKKTDGILFVADSQKDAEEKNKESLNNLENILKTQIIDIHQMPLVIQYNKSDLKNKSSVNKLRAELNRYNNKDFESSAKEGYGVVEPLKTLCRYVITQLKSGEIP